MNNTIQKLNHPSVLQIQYLIELEKTGNGRGCVATVADQCGVSHGPVSRFFRECIACGYLTEKYDFTESGVQALEMYKKILRNVRDYLERIGVKKEEIPEKLRQMVENVDYDLLFTITKSDTRLREHTSHEAEEEDVPYFLENILEMGRYEVGIAIHQLNRGDKTRLSMAHRGFEHIACVRHNTRGSWLELTICPMHARSRIDGEEMTGYLSSLKYEKQGQLFEANIRDGRLRIPLSACHFMKGHRGNIKGMIPITVTCSVGKAHMPESTALLTFWM